MENVILTDGFHFITEVPDPPARYRVSVFGMTEWYASGPDAVEAYHHGVAFAGSDQHVSLYDEWAERFVSVADAICGFPRLEKPHA